MAAVQSHIYAHITAAERFICLKNGYVLSKSERGKKVKRKNMKKHFLEENIFALKRVRF